MNDVMIKKLLIAGAIFCGTGVGLGALGAHSLKTVLNNSALNSFETAVRYQLIHGLALMILALMPLISDATKKTIGWLFILGTLLFSVSIYLLSIQSILQLKLAFLGPVTPVGGLLLLSGWAWLIFKLFQYKTVKH